MSNTPLRVVPPSGEQQRVWRLLGLLLGGGDEARVVCDAALRSAGLRELPGAPADLLEFVGTHVAPLLREVLGERVTAALLEEMGEAMYAPPSSKRIAIDQPAERAVVLGAMPLSQVGATLIHRRRRGMNSEVSRPASTQIAKSRNSCGLPTYEPWIMMAR